MIHPPIESATPMMCHPLLTPPPARCGVWRWRQRVHWPLGPNLKFLLHMFGVATTERLESRSETTELLLGNNCALTCSNPPDKSSIFPRMHGFVCRDENERGRKTLSEWNRAFVFGFVTWKSSIFVVLLLVSLISVSLGVSGASTTAHHGHQTAWPKAILVSFGPDFLFEGSHVSHLGLIMQCFLCACRDTYFSNSNIARAPFRHQGVHPSL